MAGYLEYRNDPTALAIQGMAERGEKKAIEFLRLQAELPLEAGGWRMFSVEERGQSGIIGEVGVFVPDDRNEGDIGW